MATIITCHTFTILSVLAILQQSPVDLFDVYLGSYGHFREACRSAMTKFISILDPNILKRLLIPYF